MAFMQLLSNCYQKTFENAENPHKYWLSLAFQFIRTRFCVLLNPCRIHIIWLFIQILPVLFYIPNHLCILSTHFGVTVSTYWVQACITKHQVLLQFLIYVPCLIIECLEKEKNTTRANIQELCGYNDNQARRTIEKFKKKNIIQNDRTGRYANYKLVRK